jgi:SAM-dependent MidA family methyltransferase
MLGDAVAAWHDDVATLPDGPLLLVANEFLDALPIRQFVRRGDGWAERHVKDGAFVEVPASPSPAGGGAPGWGCEDERALTNAPPPHPSPALRGREALGGRGGDITEGAILETCEPAQDFVRRLGARLAAQRGAALFFDYGYVGPAFGDTLQAMRAHETGLDPLAEPGTRDITAHVDFAAVAAAAREGGAVAHGPLPQGLVLQRLGLMTRAAMLAQARPRLAPEILSGAERLVAPEAMGRLFKALAVCDAATGTPPGFDAP